MLKKLVFIIFYIVFSSKLISENNIKINEYRAVFTNSKGEKFVSTNSGKGWDIINEVDTEYAAVLTRSNGEKLITYNSGKKWEILNEQIEKMNNAQIIIYPNPVYNELVVSFSELSEKLRVEIVDLSGKKILEKSEINLKVFSLNLGSLNSGTYLINIYQQKKLINSQKVIKLE